MLKDRKDIKDLSLKIIKAIAFIDVLLDVINDFIIRIIVSKDKYTIGDVINKLKDLYTQWI